MPQTLYDKLWNTHVVHENEDGTAILYIDRHLIHEVTSPQAFEGLRLSGRRPWRVDSMIAVPDHNVPTTPNRNTIRDPVSREQLETLDRNCDEYGITEFRLKDFRQGIVHIIGPEQGFTLPGMTIVCGDSHTATHGAFGALAFGIGTSDVEHVLATQTLVLKKSRNMRIEVTGTLSRGVTAKDLILAIIAHIGTAGGTGHAIEFTGDAIESLSMEGRMTICNMTIEAGARSGMMAVDQKTIDYITGRPYAPKGEMLEKAIKTWLHLKSAQGAVFDKTIVINAAGIKPQVSWGTSPEMVVAIDGVVPAPEQFEDESKRIGVSNALNYMGLQPGTPIQAIKVDKIFIGSCTNARIEDLREAAAVVKNRRLASNIKLAMVVPGSGLVKRQAEEEGLDKIFISAGFEWREPGCSMCLGMNEDQLNPKERCASTSNRNFEGRQGAGGRTHLVSPAMAAAAAIAGHFVDVRSC